MVGVYRPRHPEPTVLVRVLFHYFSQFLAEPEWAERILYWRHTGFNVHSLVRAKTKPEAERVGKYMTRPVLSLERLSFLKPEGKVGSRKLRFIAEKPPPSHVLTEVALTAAEESGEYF